MCPSDYGSSETSYHLQRALAGDEDHLRQLIDRLAPLLLLQAERRLGPHLRQFHDAEDLVQDAWAVLLPRLSDLKAREGRLTPVLLRFLSQTILNRVRTLLQKHIREVPASSLQQEEASIAIGEPADDASGVVTRLLRGEEFARVWQVIQSLGEQDQQLLIQRGIEQNSLKQTAVVLQLKPNTVAVKYRRLLEKLRAALPDSLFAEFDLDDVEEE
jgi:RNA polymerase sigma-70 factor (ECF subfamily)